MYLSRPMAGAPHHLNGQQHWRAAVNLLPKSYPVNINKNKTQIQL